MSNVWMVRAGENSRLINEFRKGYIAVGFDALGDMSATVEYEAFKKYFKDMYPDEKPGSIAGQIAMFYKFRSTMQVGDKVVTYDSTTREYLIGSILSDYQYEPNIVGDYPHYRKVKWEGSISRDRLTPAARNSLGSTLTIFSVNEDIWKEIVLFLSGEQSMSKTINVIDEKDEFEQLKDDTVDRARELIKDRLLGLSASEMEQLAAAILRAMGYRTRISPKGPDQGVDVFASPDGLGFEEPRIKTEVKHRPKTSISSQDIRSFLGGLRPGDKGLYISTGGFTLDAKYEAQRSNIPLSLVSLDDLAVLVVTYYESFDLDGRALIPLVKIYWPV